jgi:diguanylate cyclase (GGDEF)-like protein/PAS domain S-box-containing protein
MFRSDSFDAAQTSVRESDHSHRPWYSDWGNLAAAGLVVYVAVFALWMIFEWGSNRALTIVQETVFPPVMLLGVIFAWRMALFTSVPRRTRQAWAVIGGAFLLWCLADSIWGYYHVTGAEIPAVSLYDPAYLISSLALAIGVLMFPAAALVGRDRTRFWIDCGIIITGLAAITAYVIIDPANLQSATVNLVEIFVLVLYPVSHMLVLIAVFSILARRPDAGSVGVLLLLGVGLVIYAGTDFWWTFLEFRELYVPDALTYTSWLVAQALLVMSPQWHYDVINRRLPASEPGLFADQLRAIVPYAAAAFGIVIVGYAVMPEMLDRLGVAVVFLTALISLVIVRQLVTLRENSELRLHREMQRVEERFRALVENSSDMITVLDDDLQCTFQSPSSQEVVHRNPDEFLGTNWMDWVSEDDLDAMHSALSRVISGQSARETIEWTMTRPDGEITNLESIVSSELDNRAVSGIVLNSRDITDRKLLEARLTYQAYHDPLTGLFNRAMFFKTLRAQLAEDHRGIALLFLDIDNFKQVNDTFGHEAGDDVLRQIATRLESVVREDDMLSRLAGDEFTVLLNGVETADDALAAAHRVIDAVDHPLQINGHWLTVSPSVGVALAESSVTTSGELLRRSDLAMYVAKGQGPGRAMAYASWMDDPSHVSIPVGDRQPG